MRTRRMVFYFVLAVVIGSAIVLSISTAYRIICFPFTPKSRWQPLEAEALREAGGPVWTSGLIPLWAVCLAVALSVYFVLRRKLAV